MKNFYLMLCLSLSTLSFVPVIGNQSNYLQSKSFSTIKIEAEEAFQYFLDEVDQDPLLTHEEQHDKIKEFIIFADNLSPEVASHLTRLLIDETRLRILGILENAGLVL